MKKRLIVLGIWSIPVITGLIVFFYISQKKEEGILFSEIEGKTSIKEEVSSNAENAPQIYFAQTTYHFGTVTQGKKVTCEYPFENRGKGELLVRKAITGCGCTAAVISGKRLKPHKKGKVRVCLNTEKRDGVQEIPILILSNDPGAPRKSLNLTGFVKVELLRQPTFFSFGEIKKGNTATATVQLRHLDNKPFKIKKVKSSSKLIDVKVTPQKNLKNSDGGYKLEAVLSPKKSVGSVNETISVYTTLKNRQKIKILVSGTVVGELKVMPPMLNFVSIQQGKSASQKIIVSKLVEEGGSETEEAFHILKVRSDLNFLQTTYSPIRVGKEYEIVVTLPQTAPVGKFHGTVKIFTDVTDQRELIVPVWGSTP